MSAYATLRITRSKARKLIMEQVFFAEDKELERVLNELLRPLLSNCQIVNDDEENDDKEVE